MATNYYETLAGLEQAIEAITISLSKCEFYHALYVSFTETGNSQVLDYNGIFSILESRLPELYAIAIEISVKSAAYMESSSKQPKRVRLYGVN